MNSAASSMRGRSKAAWNSLGESSRQRSRRREETMESPDRTGKALQYSRRVFIQRASLLGGMIALGGGSYLYQPKRSWSADPIKVGIATDITGPISWAGI